MLRELIQWIRTPASKSAREIGYVYSSVALSTRARRQSESWKSHIKSCHDFWYEILETHCPASVAVVGSGPLTELPIEKILSQIETLELIDLVHPREVLRKYGRHPKIQLTRLDITGVVDWIQSGIHRNDFNLNFHPPKWQSPVDLVVSANVLSQLSLEPVWYLTRKRGFSEEDPRLKNVISQLCEQHIHWLRSVGRTAYLYTDVERRYLSPSGEVLETYSSRVQGLPGKPVSEWSWTIAPLGEESKEYSVEMRVQAYRI